MRGLRVYLTGRMTDLPDKGRAWRQCYIEEINREINNIEYIGPEIGSVVKDSSSIVGADIKMIQESDIIIVNATIPFMVGGPMELMLAKYFNKLTIVIIEEKSPYYSRHGIHPWLEVFSDCIVKSIEEAVNIIKKYQINEGSINVKAWREILHGRI